MQSATNVPTRTATEKGLAAKHSAEFWRNRDDYAGGRSVLKWGKAPKRCLLAVLQLVKLLVKVGDLMNALASLCQHFMQQCIGNQVNQTHG